MFATPLIKRTLLTSAQLTRPASRFTEIYRPVFSPIRTFSSTNAQMGVHNISSSKEFREAIDNAKGLVVVDAFAVWCGPCKVIAPQLVKFSEEFPAVTFYKVDVDDVPDVAQELGVRAMPTFYLFKDGSKVADVVGANPAAILSAINTHQ